MRSTGAMLSVPQARAAIACAGAALRYVQELQATLPPPRVKNHAEKSGYQPKGGVSRRGQSFLEKRKAVWQGK